MLKSNLWGSRLKPGMVAGHGWVEHGSSQVIRSSNIEAKSVPMNCQCWLFEFAGSSIKEASDYRYEILDYLFYFSRIKASWIRQGFTLYVLTLCVWFLFKSSRVYILNITLGCTLLLILDLSRVIHLVYFCKF